MRTIRYNLLSFLTFLISLIGFIGLKLVIVAVAIGISLLTDKYVGGFGLTIGCFIGLCVGGILLFGLQRLYPYLERLDDYTKTFKQYPYTEKYGRNYPQPKPEGFGITREEFKDYNKRFQLDYIKLLFTYGLVIAVNVYVIRGKIKGTTGILLIGITVMVAIILNYLFDYWNKKLSQRHRYYDKIHKFQDSMHIYHRIMDENSNI